MQFNRMFSQWPHTFFNIFHLALKLLTFQSHSFVFIRNRQPLNSFRGFPSLSPGSARERAWQRMRGLLVACALELVRAFSASQCEVQSCAAGWPAANLDANYVVQSLLTACAASANQALGSKKHLAFESSRTIGRPKLLQH